MDCTAAGSRGSVLFFILSTNECNLSNCLVRNVKLAFSQLLKLATSRTMSTMTKIKRQLMLTDVSEVLDIPAS